MADEFNSGLNWWDRTVAASSSSSPSVLNNSLGAFGWVPGITDINARPSSVSASSIVFQDNPKFQIGAADFNMMGLGLSSQAMDWNQTFIRGEEHNLNTSNSNYEQELLLGSENQAYHENRSIYQYRNDDQLLPNPQFSRNSPPKHGQLHFSNNAPFWNPSAMQTQFPTANFNGKTKNKCEVGDSSTVLKKSGNETSSKRPRNETLSTPTFKVRKEKMGDRITALQQLVSPFGKTDTASVLSETIEYIKFFHDQVNVLSTPYKKNGAATQHQLNCEMSEELEEFKQDLRSRGLCLVPVSSTFPVTHESTMDFWTP